MIIEKMRTVEQEHVLKITCELLQTLAQILAMQDAITTAGGKQQLIQKQYPWNLIPSPAARAVILDVLCLALG